MVLLFGCQRPVPWTILPHSSLLVKTTYFYMNLNLFLESWKKYRLARQEENLEGYLKSSKIAQMATDIFNKRLQRVAGIPFRKYKALQDKNEERLARRGEGMEPEIGEDPKEAFLRRAGAMWAQSDVRERRADALKKVRAIRRRKKR